MKAEKPNTVPPGDQETGCCPPVSLSQAVPVPSGRVEMCQSDFWCHNTWQGSTGSYLGRGGGAVVGRKTKLSERVWHVSCKEEEPHLNANRALIKGVIHQ